MLYVHTGSRALPFYISDLLNTFLILSHPLDGQSNIEIQQIYITYIEEMSFRPSAHI